MLTRQLWLVLLGVLLLWPLGVRAEVLTFAMEGPITFKDDRVGLLDFAHLGDRVVYTFSFNTDAPDSNSTPQLGQYAGVSASFRVAEMAFATTPPAMLIQQGDSFNVSSSVELDGRSAGLLFGLWDSDDVAISAPALPLQPYGLAQFESKYFDFYVDVVPAVPPDTGSSTRLTFGGAVDRLYVVPEPATAVLAGLGLLSLQRKRR